MTNDALLGPFDENVLSTVAAANDIELEPLKAAVAEHQKVMQENPGVEDLVYEWRKQYDDPVLSRTADVFVVALPPTIWEQYGDYLDFEAAMLAAVVAVHQEQTVRTESVDIASLPKNYTALVAGRI